MALTLTHPTAGPANTPVVLTLPPDLIWSNEFAWRPIEQTSQHTTTGALVVDQWTRQTGRAIELRGDAQSGWIARSALRTLHAWSAAPGVTFSLSINGSAYSVIFDHAAGALKAEPVVAFADPIDADWYIPTLYFLTA